MHRILLLRRPLRRASVRSSHALRAGRGRHVTTRRNRRRHRANASPKRATASRRRSAPRPTPSRPRTSTPSRAARTRCSTRSILQAPGVAQDSFGQLHIRGEHNGLQYRLNGIIIPEGISVFGQTLDPRLADSVKLITGALPAEYGDCAPPASSTCRPRPACSSPAARSASMAAATAQITPSFDYGGSSGGFNYFVSGDYTTDTLGIESPDGSVRPAARPHQAVARLRVPAGHPRPEQQRHRDPRHLERHVRDSELARAAADRPRRHHRPRVRTACSRRTARPPSPATTSTNASARSPTTASSATCARKARSTSRSRAFGRYSSLYFTPGGDVGDLLYNGIAQTAYKRDEAYGLQAEGAWHAGDSHTLRFGVDLSGRRSGQRHLVAGAAGRTASGNQTSRTRRSTILDNGTKHAWSYSVYLQDEWKLFPIADGELRPALRPVPGLRRTRTSSARASTWCGRRPTRRRSMPAISRYFSPPPFELVATTDIALFAGTTARRRPPPTTRPRPSAPTITTSASTRSSATS